VVAEAVLEGADGHLLTLHLEELLLILAELAAQLVIVEAELLHGHALRLTRRGRSERRTHRLLHGDRGTRRIDERVQQLEIGRLLRLDGRAEAVNLLLIGAHQALHCGCACISSKCSEL